MAAHLVGVAQPLEHDRHPVGQPHPQYLDHRVALVGVASAVGSLEAGGTAVLAGSVFPGPPLAMAPEALVRGRHSLIGVHNYEPQHLAAAVALLSSPAASVLADPAVLSIPVGLDGAAAAFAAPTAHLRTLVRP